MYGIITEMTFLLIVNYENKNVLRYTIYSTLVTISFILETSFIMSTLI